MENYIFFKIRFSATIQLYLADTFKIVYISNIVKTLKNIINSKRYTQSKCNKYLIIFIEKKGRYVSYS